MCIRDSRVVIKAVEVEETTKGGLIPVSYTHLDVYKRQLQNIPAYVLGEEVKPFALYMAPLTSDEREILADGCLINYYKR